MLDANIAAAVLDAVNGVATLPDPVTPLKVRLIRVNGSATVNGTEVSTAAGGGVGAGYTAGGQSVAFDAAVAGTETAAALSADVVWANLAATTVAGIEVWDSDTPPKRWQLGPLPLARTVVDGSSFTLSAALVADTLT
jgi:hypothetical protein